MIVLDLEWNRGYDKTPLDEILQIGAVRLERPGGPILDTFCVFIRPQVHKRLNRTAKALPEIQSSLEAQLDFPSAYEQFIRWCGGDRLFAAWGADDFDTLRSNCDFWKLPPLATDTICDFQTAFSLTLGTRQNIGLAWAVDYCQIPAPFLFHNALNDAMYTALVGAWLSPETLRLASMPRWVLRFADHPYPPQPRRPVGPHTTLPAALNGRDSRRGDCPVCGQRIWIQSWNYGQEGTYFTDLHCPLHGHFPCRLTLFSTEEGKWRGYQEIPAPALPLLEEIGRAGCVHVCKGSSRRRRRPRKHSRKKRVSAPETSTEKEFSHE